MDLGLDRLVEMIEERFGKWAGTVTLAAVACGAIALAIHALFTDLIIPVVRYITELVGYLTGTGKPPTSFSPTWAEFFIQIMISLIIGVSYFFAEKWINRSTKRYTEKLLADAVAKIKAAQLESNAPNISEVP